MLRAGLWALLSHWRRHPLQLFMLLAGLALATALWSGVQAINAEARASYARAAALTGQDRLAQLVARDGGRIGEQVFVALRRAGWLVSPVLEGEARFGDLRLRVLGIEPVTAPVPTALPGGEAGGGLLPFITPPGSYLAEAGTAGRLRSRTTVPVHEAGGLPPGLILTDIGQAQALLGAGGTISRLLVAPEQPLMQRPLAEVAPDLVLKEPEAGSDLSRLTDSFHLNLTAFGQLAFAVGLFIVHSAIGLAFEQRRPMFRTLRALGLPARALVLLLLAELLALTLAGGGAGLGLGYLVAAALLPDVAATLGGLYGAAVPGSLTLRPVWAAEGLGMAGLGTLAAAAGSLWALWRLPVLDGARAGAWAGAARQGRQRQAAAALALLALGAGLAVWGQGLVAGFALLGAFLLGAALALPSVLSALLSFGGRTARGPLSEWFWADARQQLPGLSLALMALMLALAANIGVGTMVASFRLTFTGWLDQRLVSELYVTARTEAEGEALRRWLEGRVDAVLPVWSVQGPLAGAPGEVYGVADHPTYRQAWPVLASLPGMWDRLAAGEGVLVNEQLARRAGLSPGDPVTLPGGWQTRILGVYSDYGNPKGQAIAGTRAFLARYPEVPKLRHALRIAPERVEALVAALDGEFGLPPGNLIRQAQVKALSLSVFERTFAVTAALDVLTLGVAGLAMLASLLTLSDMRRAALAPVWAMGLTLRRLAALDLLRSLMLAGLTFLAALPVGLGLGWLLLAVVNVAAFGWRLPMQVFPADWLAAGLAALLAGGLAAALPVLRIARATPAGLLRVFANER